MYTLVLRSLPKKVMDEHEIYALCCVASTMKLQVLMNSILCFVACQITLRVLMNSMLLCCVAYQITLRELMRLALYSLVKFARPTLPQKVDKGRLRSSRR
jgi:hypothetical protein